MIIRRVILVVLLTTLALLTVVGCGDKIAIPEPTGLFSTAQYIQDAKYDDEALQIVTIQGNLFVIRSDSLIKRNQNYESLDGVGGFGDARALCHEAIDDLVFVWDEQLKRVSWYRSSDLEPPSGDVPFSDLPDVQTCIAMATNSYGRLQVDGATTYLYLADPDSGVVHRYAYIPGGGLVAHGILCSDEGQGARSIHDPRGMVTDSGGFLLVCEADIERNWVVRFDGTPDTTDVADEGEGEDPLRGTAALFRAATCDPPAATDYVLGNAAICNETDWEGGPSEAEGEFHDPTAVSIDGLGRIFVSDTANNRIQVFQPDGYYDFLYSVTDTVFVPESLASVDFRTSSTNVNYGAYLYVVSGPQVFRFISGEHYNWQYTQYPPEEE